VDLRAHDLTRCQELILRFLDLSRGLFDLGSLGVVSGGTYAVVNSDYPQVGLANLLKILFRSRDAVLPPGYKLERWGPNSGQGRVWNVLDPLGSLFHRAFDPERAALNAWLDAHGGGVPSNWTGLDVFTMESQE
jgi:hypothetical protein